MQGDFIPQTGYRDLRFGMSSMEAAAFLGTETASTNLWEEFDYEPEELQYVQGRVDKVYAGYPPYHDIAELTYQDDKLVGIHLRTSQQPVMFQGIDLFGNDRKAVIDRLFEIDEDLYGDRMVGFFAELGIVITWPSGKKQGREFIQFVDSEDVLNRLDFDMLDPLDAPLK